ncbi:MAG: hypothetical protein WC736_15175 [Gallionella sp.]|jgi:hypothetical protein
MKTTTELNGSEKMMLIGREFMRNYLSCTIVSVSNSHIREHILDTMKRLPQFLVERHNPYIYSAEPTPTGIPPSTWCVYGTNPLQLEGFYSRTFVWPDGKARLAPLMFMIMLDDPFDEQMNSTQEMIMIVQRSTPEVLILIDMYDRVKILHDALGFEKKLPTLAL